MLCCTQLCPTLCDPMDYSLPRTSDHGDSLGKNTGVGCHALLQGIFPTQGSNPGLPHCRWILLPSQPPRKPNIAINISNIQERKEREALPLTSLPPSPSSVAINISPGNSVEIPVEKKTLTHVFRWGKLPGRSILSFGINQFPPLVSTHLERKTCFKRLM